MTIDKQLIREMAENYWRTRLPATQRGDFVLAQDAATQFERRIAETATALGPIEGAAFQQAMDAEREALLNEYQHDPVGLKRRLGIALGVDGPSQHRVTYGTVLADTAVRTVVRATIWEAIWKLFR